MEPRHGLRNKLSMAIQLSLRPSCRTMDLCSHACLNRTDGIHLNCNWNKSFLPKFFLAGIFFFLQKQGNLVIQWVVNRSQGWLMFKLILIRAAFWEQRKNNHQSKVNTVLKGLSSFSITNTDWFCWNSSHGGFVKAEDLPRLLNKPLDHQLSKAQETKRQP